MKRTGFSLIALIVLSCGCSASKSTASATDQQASKEKTVTEKTTRPAEPKTTTGTIKELRYDR